MKLVKKNKPTSNKTIKLTETQEEVKEDYTKYHPLENNPLFKVDDDYKKKLEKAFGIKIEK